MGRWQVLAVIAALALAAIPASGQAPGPGMPQGPEQATQLYEDTLLLRAIRTLDLSSEQLTVLLGLNGSVLEERQELEQLRTSTWAEAGDAIEAVLAAWTARQTPSASNRTAADRAVNRVNQARASYAAARQRAAETLYAQLSAEQRALVESPGLAEERTARVARMGGTQSPGEYVLAEIDAIRDLMPDEFRMLAGAEAQRVATAIVGPNAPTLQQMTAGVLDVLQQVYGWTPERYRDQRATLPEQIETLLGIEELSERAPVPWSELVRLMESARTPIVVAEILPAGEGEVE